MLSLGLQISKPFQLIGPVRIKGSFYLAMGLLTDTQYCGCACTGNAGNYSDVVSMDAFIITMALFTLAFGHGG